MQSTMKIGRFGRRPLRVENLSSDKSSQSICDKKPRWNDLIGAGLDRTVSSLRPFLSEPRFGKNLPVTMLGHGVRLTISSLALCVASSAGAQGDLGQSKTATQLYASNCSDLSRIAGKR